MKIIPTPLPGVLLIEPRVFGDPRGFFLESYHAQRYRDAGLPETFVQDNHSRSAHGVLRGLHFQRRHPQGKLVRVVRGEVYDVAVDLRPGSASFGEWFGATLSEENHLQMYVPPGFAHGFCVTSDSADFLYKCTDYYHPDDEGGVLWNDPSLDVRWPLEQTLLSAKDAALPRLQDLRPEQLPSVAVTR